MAEKRVEFTGVDNGLGAMMTRFRRDSQELGKGLLDDARKYADSGKDQVEFLEEQIRLMERRSRLEKEEQHYEAKSRYKDDLDSARGGREKGAAGDRFKDATAGINDDFQEEKLQTQLMREMIETIKITAKEEIAEDRMSVERQIDEFNKAIASGANIDSETVLKTRIQEELLRKEGGPAEANKGAMAVMSGMLGAGIFQRFSGMTKGIPTAGSEYDLISPAASIVGGMAGGAAGLTASAFTALQAELEVVGTELGMQVGEFQGAAIQRHIQTREEREEAEFSIRRMTGESVISTKNLENLGIDQIESLRLREKVIRASGRTSQKYDPLRAENAAALVGFTGEEAYMKFGQYHRMDKDTGRSMDSQAIDAMEILKEYTGSADRTLLPDLLNSQGILIDRISSVSEDIDPARMAQIVAAFGKVGGAFSLSDPRAAQNIAGIQGDLSSQGNEFVQAANYAVLRKLNPTGDLFDIQRMQEKGLDTPGFMSGVIEDVVSRGGSSGFQKLELKRRLPSQSSDNIERLYNKRTSLGRALEDTEIPFERDPGAIAGYTSEAVSLVTDITKSKAAIQNAFIESGTAGILEVSTRFGDMMYDAMSGALDDLTSKLTNMGRSTPPSNKKKPLIRTPNSYIPGVTPGDLDENGTPTPRYE